MKYDTFTRIIDAVEESERKSDELYKLGIDVTGYITHLEDAAVAALEDAFPETAEDIEYFMWELNFGRNYKYGMVTDEFGRNVSLKDVNELYTWCITRQYNVEYLENDKHGIVAYGRYRGLYFWVRENGWLDHKYYCAYIELTGTQWHGCDDGPFSGLCHGGVTYFNPVLPWAWNDTDEGPDAPYWYIGWDYAHMGDEQHGWTVPEVVEEICEVIDKLAGGEYDV